MTNKEVQVPARLYRAASLEATPSREDGGQVVVTFSSETPIWRVFNSERQGWEILGHDSAEVDLSRMETGAAPVLLDHIERIDHQVGVVKSVEISGGQGRAVLRLGKSARAKEVRERIRDGEVLGISVGYTVKRLRREEDIDGRPAYRATLWTPTEISFVPVPADLSAGVWRSAEGEDSTTTIIITEDSDMPKEITPAADLGDDVQDQSARAQAPKAPAAAVDHSAVLRSDRARTKEIRALGAKFEVEEATITRAIESDMTVDAFSRSILDGMGTNEAEATRSRQAEVGLSEREVSRYSLMNAVRFLANPDNAGARKAAAFEIEVSEAAEQKLGRSAHGLMVPADILSHQDFTRTQSVGTVADGGHLVQADLLDGSFIGLLRKRAALTRAGVRVISGLVGNVDIPRQTGGATAYWVGEGDDSTDSKTTYDKVSLTPHTLAASVPITRRAMLQTTPDIEALVRDDLVKIMALAISDCGINGSADADAPNGLKDFAINTVDFATANQPTFAEIVALESAIAADDADVDAMRYMVNAAMRGHLKTAEKAANTAQFIWDMENRVNGYETVVSNQVATGDVLLGNWSDFIMGMWSGLDLTVDKAALAASGGVVLRAFQDLDFAVRHVESFAHGYDIS